MKSVHAQARSSSRRRFLGLAVNVAALLPVSAWSRAVPKVRRIGSSSLDLAYAFLDGMMDRYFHGSTLRLVQSYVPTPALRLRDIGFTYDNALVVIALLQRGTPDDVTRANVLGASLLYAQAHDPIGDGRVRDGYHADPFVKRGGAVNIAFDDGDGGSDCGNLAWTGLAFAHLYAATNDASYLNAALALGGWIQKNAYDTRGAGGYTGGIAQNQHAIAYKSTEHNIDIAALFTMLAAFTGHSAWTAGAAHASAFVNAMWNAARSFYWVGTLDDGVTIKKTFIPEDVQTWGFLAFENAQGAAAIDWAYKHLYVDAKPYVGVSFSNADTSGVWFEGTAHLAAALLARNAFGDLGKAQALLSSIAVAQTHAPHDDGMGIVAASKDGLRTGDGDKYCTALHIGATSWYCIAAQGGNPLRL